MRVTRLLREHAKLRSLGADLVSVVSSPGVCDFSELARRRWDLARMVHLHLAYEEREIFSRLEADPRPEVCAASADAKRRIERLHFRYKEHVELWDVNQVRNRWPEFQAAVRTLVREMVFRIDKEEANLLPYIQDDEHPDRNWKIGMRNWAGDGVALQPFIKGDSSGPEDPLQEGGEWGQFLRRK